MSRKRKRFVQRKMTGNEKAQELRVVAPLYESAASGYLRVVLPLKTLVDQGQIKAIWKDLLPLDSLDKDGIGDDPSKVDPKIVRLLTGIMNWSNVIFLEREERAKEIMPALLKAAKQGKAMVFEIDDHVMSFPDIPEERVANFWRDRMPGFLAVLNQADLLIATTEELVRVYRPLLKDGAGAVCIPNYLDTRHPRWQVPKPTSSNGEVVIGWQGGWTHKDDLELLRIPLGIVLRNHPEAIFKCVGLQPEWLDELPQDQVRADSGYTHLFDFPARMGDFDIGLIPLENNEFNVTGKSDLKFLEFSMLRLPSIASDRAPYNYSISKKLGIRVKDDPSEWVKAIEALLGSVALRTKFGENAHKYVNGSRSIYHNAYRWAEAFDEARRIRQRIGSEE